VLLRGLGLRGRRWHGHTFFADFARRRSNFGFVAAASTTPGSRQPNEIPFGTSGRLLSRDERAWQREEPDEQQADQPVCDSRRRRCDPR
jgi:hypothetical protein